MRENVSIGSVPNDEPCIQIGSENYDKYSKKECLAYINQLTRVHGDPPPGAYYKTTANPHDFGTYYEVEIFFTDGNETHEDYVYGKCECGCEKWDDEAKKELGEEYFTILLNSYNNLKY